MEVRVHRSTLVPLVVIGLLAVACEAPSTPSTPPTVAALAAGWSAGRSDPRCGDRGPRGEYLGPIPGAEHCQWPTVSRGREFGTVFATRDSINGWTSLTWERVLADTSRVRTVLDSLETEFLRAGLSAHACAGGGRRWQAPGLVVQTSAATVRAAGGIVVLVFVAAQAASIPTLLCPDAPPLQDPPDARTRAS